MPYVDVTVDVDIDIFEDQELIDELENRGWWVSPETGWEPLQISEEHQQWICDTILQYNLDVNDLVGKDIYEELRKR